VLRLVIPQSVPLGRVLERVAAAYDRSPLVRAIVHPVSTKCCHCRRHFHVRVCSLLLPLLCMCWSLNTSSGWYGEDDPARLTGLPKAVNGSGSTYASADYRWLKFRRSFALSFCQLPQERAFRDLTAGTGEACCVQQPLPSNPRLLASPAYVRRPWCRRPPTHLVAAGTSKATR
jgi:hypothetical protein